jgi:HD-GYP domain-containing protein (c-di-GMP phosphodiesterase class II)
MEKRRRFVFSKKRLTSMRIWSRLKLNLFQQFSLLSFILLSIIAISLSLVIQQQLEKNVLMLVADQAADQVGSLLDPVLSSQDLIYPIDPLRYSQIDAIVRQHILSQSHIVRVKIWNRDRVIIYSDKQELVGQRFPIKDELQAAFNGELAMDITSLKADENIYEKGNFDRLSEVYVPIRLANSSNVVGAYEIYHDLTLVYPRIDQMRRVVWLGIGISFLILFFSLFSLVRSASQELTKSNAEILYLYSTKKHQLAETERAEEDLQRNFQVQTVLSELLRISLSDVTLNDQLLRVLEHVFPIPWLSLEAKGCIFLVGDDPKVLVMKAQHGLSNPLLMMCAQVPFGRCLCGQAALLGKIVHVAQVDDRHNNHYEGMPPHGHYCVPILSSGKVLGVMALYLKEGHQSNDKEVSFLGSVADVLAGIIERKRAGSELEQTVEMLRNTLGGTIQVIAMTTEIRDPYTAGHQRRVSDLSRAIATEMNLSPDRIDNLRIAGNVHDLGKISVPAEILSKPGRLSSLESAMIKTHPQVGFDILKSAFPSSIAQIVLQHHERMDRSGYPSGLSGNDILLEARILAVADVVEAIASHRPYRPSLGIDKALEEINKNRGVLYDPQVVDACLVIFNERGYKFQE